MEWIGSPEAWIALATLTLLEIVLGIDNIVFISILADRVEPARQARARQVGLLLAMGTRIALLVSIVGIMKLTTPLFTLVGKAFSGRDLILLAGGVFLLTKSTREIHHKLEGEDDGRQGGKRASFFSVIVQIALLDIIFSLDSVITAVGVADHLSVMIIAVVVAVGFMIVSASTVSHFINAHPTVKMLALSFLLLIGMALVAEGFHQEIPKGYIYFAMGFSLFVEMLNLRAKEGSRPVVLHGPRLDDPPEGESSGGDPQSAAKRPGSAV
ncbi:MAG: TerC family protein [Gemmatimonadota bacterium]|jgi:predicted tellurium resistance membrane protein TerC